MRFLWGALKGARGNSGVILSQLFRGLSKGLAGIDSATPLDFARAMQDGVDAASGLSMKPKEGTILTVAKDMAKAAVRCASRGDNIFMVLDAVIEQGAQTLRKTPDMLPVLKEAGVVDAGGKGLLVIYRGFKMAWTANLSPIISCSNRRTRLIFRKCQVVRT